MRRLFPAALALLLAACSKPAEDRPRLVNPGLPAPEILLPKLLNSPLKSLSGWKDLKGRAVVLEFWASWCEPCVDNIPHLNGLAEAFRDKPVVFISVTDESEAAVAAFLKEHRLEGWVAPEGGPEVFKAFRVYGRPHTVLIDRDGRVAAVTYPSEVTEGTLDALLAGRLSRGKSAAPEAPEAGEPDPAVLAEFYIARSSGAASVKYRQDYFLARGVTLRQAFGFLLGSPERLDLGPGTAAQVDAVYDIRLTAPVTASAADRKPELFVKGLAFSLGLKVSSSLNEEEVYALRTAPGGLRGARRVKDFADISFDGVTLKAPGASFLVLASRLRDRLGLPVLDETGEEGPLDYSFTFESGDPRTVDAQLRRGLGLRLDRVKRRIRVVTVRK